MGIMGITHKNSNAALFVQSYQLTNGKKALSFRCNRFLDKKDPRIIEIYKDALQSKAKTTVLPFCRETDEFGVCGNTRGHLTECRCCTLDRKKHNKARREYENKVLNSVDLILQNEHPTHLKLASFCSGRLLGEEILLFRLFDCLQRKGFKGTIELFFIDTEYETPINQSATGVSLEQSVGGAKYIEQFLKEISMCLPKDITLKGTFFGHSNDYLSAVQSNQAFKHHLLIGADVMGQYKEMGPVGQAAGLNPQIKPIALLHANHTPLVCLINPQGELQNCNNVSESNSDGSGPNIPLIVGIAAFILLGVIVGGTVIASRQGRGKGQATAKAHA